MLPKWCSAARPGLVACQWRWHAPPSSTTGLVGQWHCTSQRSVALDSRQCNALLSSALLLYLVQCCAAWACWMPPVPAIYRLLGAMLRGLGLLDAGMCSVSE